jgi:hypothetical protein
MQKDAYYFPHFCNARHDRKIKRLRKELGLEGYGIYFMLLETLREQQDLMYPIDDIDLLAEEFGTSEQKIRVVICNYELFQLDLEQKFFSPKMLIYLEPYFKMKEQRREAGLKSAAKRLSNDRSTTVQRPFNKVKESKEEESKEEKNKVEIKTTYSLNPVRNELFEKWIKYKKEKKSTYTPSGINQLLKEWEDVPTTDLEKAINLSIANNWQGLFPPKKNNFIPGSNDSKNSTTLQDKPIIPIEWQ